MNDREGNAEIDAIIEAMAAERGITPAQMERQLQDEAQAWVAANCPEEQDDLYRGMRAACVGSLLAWGLVLLAVWGGWVLLT